MARPIPLELPKRDPREELRDRLQQAPLEHAEAILASFEVLQGLHDCRVLELLRGVLGGGDKILEIVVESTKTPEAVRGIRNLLIMTKILGSIEPEMLEEFAQAVPDALGGVAKEIFFSTKSLIRAAKLNLRIRPTKARQRHGRLLPALTLLAMFLFENGRPHPTQRLCAEPL